MKRIVSVLLVIAIISISLMTGCSGGVQKGDASEQEKETASQTQAEEPVTPAGQFPIVKDKVTISCFINQNVEVSNLVDNDFTKFLENLTNIHLNIIAVPNAQAREKKNLLLSSGDYPDIFLSGGFTNLDMINYGVSEKVFIPINSYIDKYGTEVKRAAEEYPTLIKDITAPDGNIYGLPTINEAYHTNVQYKLWMNIKWLEKLGMKKPETTDEMYDTLKAFKQKDPNGNGKQDEIALSGANDAGGTAPWVFFLNSFIYSDKDNLYKYMNNGKVEFAANKLEFKEGLRYVARLYKEGLIDPASFTQGYKQTAQVGNKEGDAILGSFTALHINMVVDAFGPRKADYDAIPPAKGPNGVRWTPSNRSVNGSYRTSGAAFAITNKCKAPEAAFRLADYLYSAEGTLNAYFGLKGAGWTDAKPGELGLSGKQAKYSRMVQQNDNTAASSRYWYQSAVRNMGGKLREDTATDQDPYATMGYERRLLIATKLYDPYLPKEVIPPLFVEKNTAEELVQMDKNIGDYVNMNIVKFITGDMDIDRDWDTYVKGLGNFKLDQWLKIYQDQIDRGSKK